MAGVATCFTNAPYYSMVYKLGSYMEQTESRNMEYKEGGGAYVWNTLPEHVRKYGCAFLNSGGGTLCIGVADDGKLLRTTTKCPLCVQYTLVNVAIKY